MHPSFVTHLKCLLGKITQQQIILSLSFASSKTAKKKDVVADLSIKKTSFTVFFRLIHLQLHSLETIPE